MSEVAVYVVDAFTKRPFAGNPAAVCPLREWLPADHMLAIANEMNLSETAFFVPRGSDYELRWFTPAVEIELCGHATLAAALVLMTEVDVTRTAVAFHTRSGALRVAREGDAYELDFPAREALPAEQHAPAVAAALGVVPIEVLASRDRVVAVLAKAAQVRELRPDMQRILALPLPGLSVTAPGDGIDADVDFVSRYFAPAKGVPEDPVTGASHCVLAPYWSARLGRTRLSARQVSRRAGELTCTLEAGRVHMKGHGVLVMRGSLHF
jgi:PhzF family phenazine biosynthesis protein